LALSPRITRYAVMIIILLLVGCAYQRHVVLVPTGLPERIYLTPQTNPYRSSRVGVFRFAAPPYARGMGKAAAEAIYNELLKEDVFLNVTDETERLYMSHEDIMGLARSKGYGLVITGDILYYFDGSALQPSRVDERMDVVHVPTEKTLWYATAIDVASPALSTDFIVFKGKGDHAPVATVLLQRNAEKFCKMLFELPPQTSVDEEKDSDSDGVYDYLDKCPGTPEGVAVDIDGCPLDSDSDGVYDYLDKCPGTPEGVAVDIDGCPLDSDSDGVYDYLDKCPGTPSGARVDENGCWIIEGIYFDFAKRDVKTEAYPVLLEVAVVLKKHPDLKVEVQGHTDNIGSWAFNLTLSRNRSKAVIEYLERADINPARLFVQGYSFSRPIASNDTPEGRAKNRRVKLKPIR